MIKGIPEVVSGRGCRRTNKHEAGSCEPWRGCSDGMDIHGAAAAFTENEPPDREHREGVQLKNTGQGLMKPHGPEFQPEITELSCLLYLHKDVAHRAEISRVLHKPEL